MKRITQGSVHHARLLGMSRAPVQSFALLFAQERPADYRSAQLAARKARDKARAKAKSAARKRGARK